MIDARCGETEADCLTTVAPLLLEI